MEEEAWFSRKMKLSWKTRKGFQGTARYPRGRVGHASYSLE
jgi:hypothetical protein